MSKRGKLGAKELQPLLKAARKAGWNEDWSKKGGTVKLTPPGGGVPLQLHGSPKNAGNEFKNKRKEMRERGIDV